MPPLSSHVWIRHFRMADLSILSSSILTLFFSNMLSPRRGARHGFPAPITSRLPPPD